MICLLCGCTSEPNTPLSYLSTQGFTNDFHTCFQDGGATVKVACIFNNKDMDMESWKRQVVAIQKKHRSTETMLARHSRTGGECCTTVEESLFTRPCKTRPPYLCAHRWGNGQLKAFVIIRSTGAILPQYIYGGIVSTYSCNAGTFLQSNRPSICR